MKLSGSYFFYPVLISTSLLFNGCYTSETTTGNSPLVGTCELTSIQVVTNGETFDFPSDQVLNCTLIFDADGDYYDVSIQDEGSINDFMGSWSLLTIRTPVGEEIYSFTLSGNTLIEWDTISEEQIVTYLMTYTKS